MAISLTTHDIGSAPNDGTGDPLRTAFDNINTDNATIASDVLLVDGSNTLTGDLVFAEKADHGSTPGAGFGYLWVKSDTPSSLIFTDDAGTDYDLTDVVTGGWADMTEAVWAGGTQSEVADGATAVAFDFDTDNTYATSGAKLASFSNNGTEKAYIDKDGNIRAGGYLYPLASDTTTYVRGLTDQLQLSANHEVEVKMGATKFHVTTQNSGTTGASLELRNAAKTSLGIAITAQNIDVVTKDITVLGQQAFPTATTNIEGGSINITGGEGASSSAGDAHGGDIILAGGTGYGTGHDGHVIMSNLPTSDPTVAGALWNDSGTLKISAG